MQTASAFNSVQSALSFFINVYRSLAEWRAVIQRLDGFSVAVAAAQTAARTPPMFDVQPVAGRAAVELEDLAVKLPSGVPLVAADDITIVAAATGAGHRPLRFGQVDAVSGDRRHLAVRLRRIRVPQGARLMMLPQRPYFPIATLATAITYPAKPGTFDRRSDCGGVDRCWTFRAGAAVGRRGALESHAVARRAATPRASRVRILQVPGLSVPRRSHRLTRRASGGRAVPVAAGTAAQHDHRLDRASLDACRRSMAGASRLSLTATVSASAKPSCSPRQSKARLNRRGCYHQRRGQISPRLGPRATRLCQANANSASISTPTPIGATRKLHDMSLTTTTSGSIPAGRVKRLRDVHRHHRKTNRQRRGPRAGPDQLHDQQPDKGCDQVAADQRARLRRGRPRRAQQQHDRGGEGDCHQREMRAGGECLHDCDRDRAAGRAGEDG